jgi:excinuclease ABC subunit C
MERLRDAMAEASADMAYEKAAVIRDKLLRLESLREQFSRLRFAVESLSFAYIVPGHDGEDRFYLIRRGVVRAEHPAPQTLADWEALRLMTEEVFSTPVRGASTTVPAHEVDELLLVTAWFTARPAELQATVGCDALGRLWDGEQQTVDGRR